MSVVSTRLTASDEMHSGFGDGCMVPHSNVCVLQERQTPVCFRRPNAFEVRLVRKNACFWSQPVTFVSRIEVSKKM